MIIRSVNDETAADKRLVNSAKAGSDRHAIETGDAPPTNRLPKLPFAARPFWLVGFRPFFSLACLAGAALPVLWALVYGGVIAGPKISFAAVQWHAHEMLFGFGWAVLGGFLLTATKNWVQVRGYHGAALMFLAAAWLFERFGMWFQDAWPPLLFLLSNWLFLVAIVALLLRTLIRHRRQDSFRDNIIFIVALPLFAVAKYLLLSPDHFQAGAGMALGLFRLAFLLMLERTLTQFMKGVFQVSILRHPGLDMPIKLSAAALVFGSLMPAWPAASLNLMLAALMLVRFAFWSPHRAMRRLEIAVMYLGYLAIVAQLLLDAADRLARPAWIGAVPVHVFAFGVIGLVVPAMMVRIAKGHTGRKVVFEPWDKAVLYTMLLAVALRIVAPQLNPGAYDVWINLAAACWCAAFSILGWRYIPFLLRPRVDGKAH